jgi:hypothetical protein
VWRAVHEFSKTIRFDFPRIPIVGTLLLMLVLLNVDDGHEVLLDKDARVSMTTVAACVFGLGVAGITLIQLFSMMFFDPLFPMKRKLVTDKKGFTSSYEWFQYLRDNAQPIPGASKRDSTKVGEEGIEDGELLRERRDIKVLTNQQVHATLHALEMECRSTSPAFGVQLEYYYSIYVFFMASALTCVSFLFLVALDQVVPTGLKFTRHAAYVDALLFLCGFFGAVRARKIKEYLRITLFNHKRGLVLSLLGSWYQCTFVRPAQQPMTAQPDQSAQAAKASAAG